MELRPPTPTLFPYTTLFRSVPDGEPLFDFADQLSKPPKPTSHLKPISRISPRYCYSRSEEHTSELQSQSNIVCRLLLEKKNNDTKNTKALIAPLICVVTNHI